MKHSGMELKPQPVKNAPETSRTPEATAPAAPRQVRKNDTLCGIAEDSGLTVDELLNRNPQFNRNWLDAPCMHADEDDGVVRKYR